MKNIRDLKDKAILLGWIAGLLFLISLLWILTGPAQAQKMLRTVNGVFITTGDNRRVSTYLHVNSGKAGLLGYWYSMYNSNDKMFVFSVFKDGILVPLGAVVSDGKVGDIIPLSAHAMKTFDAIPESFLQVYVTRIEESIPDSEGGGR